MGVAATLTKFSVSAFCGRRVETAQYYDMVALLPLLLFGLWAVGDDDDGAAAAAGGAVIVAAGDAAVPPAFVLARDAAVALIFLTATVKQTSVTLATCRRMTGEAIYLLRALRRFDAAAFRGMVKPHFVAHYGQLAASGLNASQLEVGVMGEALHRYAKRFWRRTRPGALRRCMAVGIQSSHR